MRKITFAAFVILIICAFHEIVFALSIQTHRANDPPPAGAGGFLNHNVNCSCPLSSFS